MLTSTQIRQSFLDFFREKMHTVVPSSSLLPDSPNLLFTNAGMNQFVPIFLGEKKADVSKWGGAIPGSDTRAADTQKCIRAGGKHNDLDDVGLDTYHHTFFEMLGNWSFGDYFKKEAIEWAWELIVERWKFPANRVYATIYQPGPGDPAERDEEAWNLWAEKFRAAGLDPAVHIVNGNKKDNFWMMGETGPCGPCSELHIDLTPLGDTRGSLVNKGVPECIEIWNLVFIQFNANPDGTFTPLPAQHVDTGMGFERVTSIIQGTKNFTDFANAKISNYETDIFRPIFDEIEKLSGQKYTSTLPATPGSAPVPGAGEGVPPSRTSEGALSDPVAGTTQDVSESSSRRDAATSARDGRAPQTSAAASQVQIDVAFRVIADHIRTLSFAIADGIQPGNNDRNYVLRRILRRAVKYGRTLGFHAPFFYKLVPVLARTMGDVFPEIRTKQKHVEETLRREEEAFNKTLDTGIEVFDRFAVMAVVRQAHKTEPVPHVVVRLHQSIAEVGKVTGSNPTEVFIQNANAELFTKLFGTLPTLNGKEAFELYDTYGFPLDLTELMARERGFFVDVSSFAQHMDEQRARARAAQKRTVITVSNDETEFEPTIFVGYDDNDLVCEVATVDGDVLVPLETPFYGEMGGQLGDTGTAVFGNESRRVLDTKRTPYGAYLHKLDAPIQAKRGDEVRLKFDSARRRAIERHHTVTHLLHWALHEVVSREATQKGSFVGPDKLTFDFNSAALTPQQVCDIERLVNEKIVENAGVQWTEVPYADVRGRADIMQFFGDKYGETVRVVDIGGFSKELCAGTHTRATGEIGLFRINSEAAIAAGVRRIEAQAGLNAYDLATLDTQRLHALATKIGTPLPELEKRIEAMLTQQKELEKALKSAQQREAAGRAKDLLASATTINGIPAIIAKIEGADGDTLQTITDALKSHGFKGVTVLGGSANGAVALVASVSSEFTAKAQAGKIIQTIAPLVGGKGGGKPDNARGGGKDPGKLDEALAHAKTLLG